MSPYEFAQLPPSILIYFWALTLSTLTAFRKCFAWIVTWLCFPDVILCVYFYQAFGLHQITEHRTVTKCSLDQVSQIPYVLFLWSCSWHLVQPGQGAGSMESGWILKMGKLSGTNFEEYEPRAHPERWVVTVTVRETEWDLHPLRNTRVWMQHSQRN